MDDQTQLQRAKMLGSFLLFTKTFYQLRTGRKFHISEPLGRESHFITIAKAFTKVLRGDITSLLINCPPGAGKSELCKHFIAWVWAHYPHSNFIYVSYSHELAAKHTHGIKNIVLMPDYRRLFGVEINRDSSAKDNFTNNFGGTVYASGSSGAITGQDAGLPNLDAFSGGLIFDDIHKPDEVHSDTMRQRVKDNYSQTLLPRLRSPKAVIIGIGQRLHEDDLPGNIISGIDGRNWERIVLKSIDDAGNALYPEVHPKEMLLNLREKSPYVYASQHQQDPQPAGGGIFQTSWFVIADQEPDIIATFVVVDSAETDKTYNNATVFSFFGIYKIKIGDIETELYGLHWLDCAELWIEPKDLQSEFLQFYSNCMHHRVKPLLAAIEKKSTGTTLISVLKDIQGLRIIELEPKKSKISRFLDCQPFVASKQVSLPSEAKHTPKCIEHMRKITANDTHTLDDIADTLSYGIQLSMIDKLIPMAAADVMQPGDIAARNIIHNHNTIKHMRAKTWQR